MKFEFFTNEKGEVDVKSPAFSITKVQATLGALITAVAGALPALADASETIKVAAIASGTVIMLGVFGLAAVDIRTRQRAAEAKLRYGSGKTGTADFVALPEKKTLVVQEDHSKVEYEVDIAVPSQCT